MDIDEVPESIADVVDHPTEVSDVSPRFATDSSKATAAGR